MILDTMSLQGNGQTDHANLLRTGFFQKPPDNPPLRLRKFEKALQDSLFFNRRYREPESRIWPSFLTRAFGRSLSL
jgi:hypothetical protein